MSVAKISFSRFNWSTHDDINEALPETIVTPDDLDQIYSKLNNLEVEIVDQSEVDRVKHPEPAEEEDEKEKEDLTAARE